MDLETVAESGLALERNLQALLHRMDANLPSMRQSGGNVGRLGVLVRAKTVARAESGRGPRWQTGPGGKENIMEPMNSKAVIGILLLLAILLAVAASHA